MTHSARESGRGAGAGSGEYLLDVAGTMVELVVEVDGGVDEGQVAEGLGEVAELLAGEADLLGVQAEVVGVINMCRLLPQKEQDPR